MTTASRNVLALGDALDVCDALASDVRFDLVYLDPPYGVGATFRARSKRGEARGREQKTSGPYAYEDPRGAAALLDLLAPRLAKIRDRMRDGATMYLHLDHRAVHEAKVACDALFGRGAFLGEIVWAPGNGGRGARGFTVTHQTILVYARSPADRRRVVYNDKDPALREPFSATSLAMHFQNVDDRGRKYRERVVNGKAYRYYADEGRRLGSVWMDIPSMVANTPLRSEGTGYPTQKPERLLERIVRASSNPGQVVADLMCGSGTTAAVAHALGRAFVASDVSELAFEIARARLERSKARFDVLALRDAAHASGAR